MSSLIYKQGQGHWTRLMSAMFWGALVAATALFVRSQLTRIDRESVPFDPLFVQWGGAVLVMILGAVLVFWFVYNGRKSGEFLIATEGEMKKVNWSTRREVLGSTRVVILISFIIAAILFGVDFVFSTFFKAIGLLKTGGS